MRAPAEMAAAGSLAWVQLESEDWLVEKQASLKLESSQSV